MPISDKLIPVRNDLFCLTDSLKIKRHSILNHIQSKFSLLRSLDKEIWSCLLDRQVESFEIKSRKQTAARQVRTTQKHKLKAIKLHINKHNSHTPGVTTEYMIKKARHKIEYLILIYKAMAILG